MRLFVFIICLLTVSTTTFAEETRIVSLKNTTTNVRAGPGTQYPILWVFKRQGWPVRIISEYQYWYKVEDHEGETGWIYKNLLSNTHTVIVSEGKPVIMYVDTEMTKPVMKLSANVTLTLDRCTPYLCQVVHNRKKGWVEKTRLLMTE
jgi:SH3-like domain-containing protein